ncbi:MAG: condensation domain-containing protein, partial [Clostridium sp.]
PDENSVIKNEYIEPTTEIEKKIAEVWKEVLSYENISITDNFFELGGDSIKGIQVISKLKESGIKLEVKYLLNHPTILQLSKYIINNDLSISQKLVQGEVPLTPIQKYFLEYNKGCNVNHFGQSVTLFSQRGFDEKLVGEVFEKLATHHDALRMTFKLEGNNFIQTNRGLSGDIYDLDTLDISYKTDDEKLHLINKRALEIQHMDLKNGPLFKGIIIRDTDGDHLYMAIHHFIVDGVSWRFIVEDFCKAYNNLNEEKRINIPSKTTSFKEWAEKLNEYANNSEVASEIDYWNDIVIDAETKFPVKKTMSNKVMNSNKLITALLSEKETELLLTDVNKAFNTEIKDILLTALALSVNSWCEKEKLAVNIEGHGREEILKGVDITRTIGWFTSIFPVLLQCNPGDISEQIIKTKEMLNSIPNKGIGYGILKYLNKDNPIKSKEIANVCFNYLGQVDNVIQKDDISISKLNINCDIGDEICSIYDLDISCIIKNKQLTVNILYNDKALDSHAINNFLKEYIGKLLDIIRYCIQHIKENKLDISQIKDIYNQPYIMLLNEKVNRNLFVFPPHMPKVAYSILYKNLSMYINDYSFYMFNFLETEKLVNHYVEKIKEIQGEGPYVLMGYSFGGALAFEAASRLIDEGREVSDVILVDSYVVEEDSFENINLEFVRANVRESLKTQYKDVITNEEFLEEIVTSFINYYIYTKDFVNSKKPLPVNLHMLRGEGEVPNIRDTRHIWPTLTTKKYYEYTGVGTHNLMLSGSYLGTNAKILMDILSNINRI